MIKFRFITAFSDGRTFKGSMITILHHKVAILFKVAFLHISLLVILVPAFISAQAASTVENPIQKCWEYKYENSADLRLETDANSVYLRRGDSGIDAVSLESGKLLWSTDVGGKIESNLVPIRDNLIFVRRSVTNESGKPETVDVRAISSATGITRWNASLSKGSSYAIGVMGDKVLAFSVDGAMQLLSVADGVEIWNRKTNVGIGTAVFTVDRAFFVTAENEIRFVTISGGESTFVAHAQFPISAFKGTSDKTLVWGDDHGNITSFGLSSNKTAWRFKSGGRVNEILRVNGYIVAASNDNFVYAISPDAGTRVWKKRFPGRIQSLIGVGDDAVLVQTLGEEKLVLVNVKDGKTSDQVSVDGLEEVPLALKDTGLDRIIVLTNTSLYRFSRNVCSAKAQNGPL